MAKKTSKVVDGVYEYFDPDEGKVTITIDIRNEPEAWLDELKRIKSLRVSYTEPKTGFRFSYSVYKKIQIIKTYDKHGQKLELYQGSFWIAHKQINKRFNRVYIGRDKNLTASRLADVAEEISQAKMDLKS